MQQNKTVSADICNYHPYAIAQSLRSIRGFNDESLSGNWEGHRSSRLNMQYRVIHQIDHQQLLVKVMRVTPYDYRSN